MNLDGLNIAAADSDDVNTVVINEPPKNVYEPPKNVYEQTANVDNQPVYEQAPVHSAVNQNVVPPYDARQSDGQAAGYVPPYVPQQPAKPAFDGFSNPVPKSPKKKKGLFIAVIAVGLAVLIAGGGLLAYFTIFKKGNNTVFNQGDCVMNVGGRTCYIGGMGVFPTDNIEYGKTETIFAKGDTSDETNSPLTGLAHISPYRCTSDGETVYGRLGDRISELYKIVKNGDRYITETWVSPETLSKVDMGSEMNGEKYANFFSYPLFYKDEVYFVNTVDIDHWNKYYPHAYKFGKISKDGSNVQYYDDICAQEFAISDDWVYFYDNGFNADSSDYDYDLTRAGIYKMKLDGTDKQPLINNINVSSEGTTKASAFSSLRVYGDYLYYIDYTTGGYGRVARLNRNNPSQPEYLTEFGARAYTFNPDSETVYYTSFQKRMEYYGQYSMDDRLVLMEANKNKSVDSKIDVSIFDTSEPTYYNGFIYFFDYSQYAMATVNVGTEPDFSDMRQSGMRYDLSNHEKSSVYKYMESTETYDADGFPETVYYGTYYRWEKSE